MYARLVSVVAAAILAASSAIAQTPATEPPPAVTQSVHLVWLITELSRGHHGEDNTDEAWRAQAADPPGYPLGVVVFPAEMPLLSCATVARLNQRGNFTPSQRVLANMIGVKIDKLIEDPTPVCLTDAEAKALVEAVKNQHDQPPGRNS